ncbi:hypothetical protein P8C59_004070 [Phyllachora maydis]|uniref:Uncharacterized protein n=1 Tax=Phyllachora maydis TaxID=1825666 RepID=A0AAD9I1V1_9PEZI|nr:hypothetical protein P8C59_004070 [Phyllachora maydis]
MYSRDAGSEKSRLKERSSNEYSAIADDDDDDDYVDYSSSSSSLSSRGFRHSSSVSSPTAVMLPKRRRRNLATRPASRRYLYRLPNKMIRYLCMGMVAIIVIFMYSLVRASQVENRRLAEGKLDRPKGAQSVEGPVWEKFEFLMRYYGGVRSIKPLDQNVPEYPRVEDEQPSSVSETRAGDGEATEDGVADTSQRNVADTAANFAQVRLPPSRPFSDHPHAKLPTAAQDQVRECFIDGANTVRVPPIRYFDGRPDGFPQHIMGSYELLSLPEDICFERHGRYGPYGFGYSQRTGGLGIGEHGDAEGADAVWSAVKKVDWTDVDWADTQRRCYEANAARYKPMETRVAPPRGWYVGGPPEPQAAKKLDKTTVEGEQSEGAMPRTAVVVRCWDEYGWDEEAIMNMRSLISELSLASGGRYDVHLLVQVRNDAKNPVWADDEVYRTLIREKIPREFQGLVTLWTETQMLSLYQGLFDLFTRGPDLPLHGSYRGLQMAMQYFAHNHAEYDYFWQWEMDIRYTGHYLDLLTKVEDFGKAQPRKGLWERNARFYVPSVHGSWEDFTHMARVQTEMGTIGAENVWSHVPGFKQDPNQIKKGEETVWGPVRPADPNDWFEADNDPVPPTSYERDKYQWGVGEEADLLTLNPIFDPDGTTWGLADDITGYNETTGKPPRRAQIITASRMSRRLLRAMHRETALAKHHAFPEMWPATAALQHGLKAVAAPHPVYVDRAWPAAYLARVFNGGRNGASGGSRAALFGDREHNVRGLSWFYNAGFAPNLYRRWLGLRVNNDGGEEFELTLDQSKNGSSVPQMRGGEGRMCLPPMLLHPIKEVELPVEQEPQAPEVAESDPAA